MATELCECSVADVIEVNRNPGRAPLDIFDHLPHKEILHQSAKAVDFLHKLNLVHRNLHPDNFLVCRIADNHYIIKLTDFQCTKNFVDQREFSGTLGSGGWIAPEGQDELDPSKTDVFILGCYFFYVLSSGKHPFGMGPIKRKERMLKPNDQVYDELNWKGGPDWGWNSTSNSLNRSMMDQVMKKKSHEINGRILYFSINRLKLIKRWI